MGRILIADDDIGIQTMLREALTFEGHEVIGVLNGQQAVEVAAREQPDLILIDIMMPVLDGREAIKQLRASPETAGLRIIAMSAGATLLVHAEELPADGVLSKPFDLTTLLAAVGVHLNRAQETNGASS